MTRIIATVATLATLLFATMNFSSHDGVAHADGPGFIVTWSASPYNVNPGESVTLRVRMYGVDGSGDHGGISVSFPSLDQSNSSSLSYKYTSSKADVDVVSYTEGRSRVTLYDRGTTIYDSHNEPMPARYLLVEADDPTWLSSSDRTLELRITPRESGTFRIYGRGWICDDNYRDCSRALPSPRSNEVDQQGFPVGTESLKVSTLPATPAPLPATPTPATLRATTPAPLPPTPTPVPGEPVVHLHAASEETKTGQPVAITLSVQNVSSDPALSFNASLKAPSGLLLNGAPCPSQGLCSAASGLSVGEQTVMQLEATANRAGEYDLVATVSWRPGDGSDSSSLSRKLKLNITDPVEGETDVILHAPRTEVNVGEAVTLTLAAANSIAKPPMTLKFVLRTPSGWTLSGAGFAEACAGQCIATYKLNTGVQRDLSLQMVPNEAGAVSVKAGMEWYFGNDLESLVIKEETLELHAVAPTPTVMGPLSEVNLPEVNLGWILFLSGVAVVGFVGFFLVWMYRQSKKR